LSLQNGEKSVRPRRMTMENKPGAIAPILKIMLIEDDPTMVSLLTTLLSLEGFTVRAPTNHHIESLLKALIEEQPQVILMDVNLHLGSGIDLVRQIRQVPEINNTRILMSSGLNLKYECIDAGADDFILKPYDPDTLIRLINTNIH
jgi:DNA-binding response OmpR family regulator